MSLKSLSASSTFKMFQMYFFECIFAQFSLDSHFFSVWNPLNLSLSRWPYYSRSSNFLAFNLSSVSKYTTLPSNEEVLSSRFDMASSLLLWLLPCCYGFFIVLTFSSNLVIFKPNSFIVSLCSFISILNESILPFDARDFTTSSNRSLNSFISHFRWTSCHIAMILILHNKFILYFSFNKSKKYLSAMKLSGWKAPIFFRKGVWSVSFLEWKW